MGDSMEEPQPEWITLDEDTSKCSTPPATDPQAVKRKASDGPSDGLSPERHHKRPKSASPSAGAAPIVTVHFASRSVARRFSDEVTKCISRMVNADFTTSSVKDGSERVSFFAAAPGDDEDDDLQVLEETGVQAVDMLPKYNSTYDGVVGVATSQSSNQTDSAKPRNSCFNCEGDHMLGDCPMPRDSARISRNRRQHQSNSLSNSRYHEDADSRYSHLQPGDISQRLREAMGLSDGELPSYIYRMRQLGYPPGWLRAARQQRTMAVHHSPKADKDQSSRADGIYYDHSKFISYVGFNVRNENMVDQHHSRGYPPMQFHQSLLKMKRDLPARGGQPRRLTLPPPVHPCPTAADMDVVDVDDEDPAPVTMNGGGSSRQAPPADGDAEDGECSNSSAESGQHRPMAGAVDDADTTADTSRGEQQQQDQDNADEDEAEAPLVRVPAPVAASTPLTLTPGTSRRRELGTPVSTPVSGRPLPAAEKWADGITEHLPFENLPGATGAWSRMSDLIKRVRQHVTGKS